MALVHLFLWLSSTPSYQRTRGCFHNLVTMNSAAVHTGVHTPLQAEFSSHLGRHPAEGWPGPLATLFLGHLTILTIPRCHHSVPVKSYGHMTTGLTMSAPRPTLVAVPPPTLSFLLSEDESTGPPAFCSDTSQALTLTGILFTSDTRSWNSLSQAQRSFSTKGRTINSAGLTSHVEKAKARTGGGARLPVLKDTCAPPAVMNSTFPRCNTPASSLRTSRTSSALNCITSIALCKTINRLGFAVRSFLRTAPTIGCSSRRQGNQKQMPDQSLFSNEDVAWAHTRARR